MKATDPTAIYMSMAYLVALGSKDQRTKIGAVVVGADGVIRSTGHNGFPRGLDDDVQARHEKPEKNTWFEHAERNAIYNASFIGVSLKESTMFTHGTPCPECARAIIQSGIKRVVVHERWDRQNSAGCASGASQQMLAECGITLEKWSGNLVDIMGWRRGARVSSVNEPAP